MSQNYDYDEDQKLKQFSKETVAISEEYAESRVIYAEAKLKMDSRLVEAYKLNRLDSKTGIKESLAIEKAYIQLTINDEETKKDYGTMIKEEQAFKGLERVLNARTGYITLHQSLLRNKPN